jgi:ferredoxin
MITKKLLFYFPECETEKPIVYRLVKDYNLMINIFRAKVTPDEEGYLVLDVTGSAEDIEKGLDYVKTFDVEINETQIGVRWDQIKCTFCGNCIPHCPTNALHFKDRRSMEVNFDSSQCIECLNCIDNCPFDACSSLF